MAKRNFFDTLSTIPDGYVPSGYQLDAEDLHILFHLGQEEDGWYKVIKAAFTYGYIMGHRATIKGTYKEAKRGKKQ